MDDIEVLESSEEGTAPSHSTFFVAPPSVVARWTQPRPRPTGVQIPRRDRQYSTVWTSNTYEGLQPIITEVKSLSPHERQVNSSYKRGVTKSQPIITAVRSLSTTMGMQPIITEVKSLSPLKRLSETNIAKFTVRKSYQPIMKDMKFSTQRKKEAKQQSGLKPLCITLDDDHDDSPPNSINSESSLSKNTESQNGVEVTFTLSTREKGEVLDSACDSGDAFLNTPEGNATDVVPSTNGSCLIPKHTSTSQKRRIQPTPVDAAPSVSIEDFVRACESVEDSADMKFIVENKIRKHYLKADKGFISSTAFRKRLRDLKVKVENDKQNLYVHITELVDELKARKASAKVTQLANNEASSPPKKKQKMELGNSSKVDYEEVENKRNEFKIKKLNTFLEKLQKIIENLEKEEVSWDDDSNSSYIMLQRYKERAVKVFNKLCEYTKESKSAGKTTKVHVSGTPIAQVNKCVSLYVNETGEFPDFVDILDIVKKANLEENLNLSEEKMEETAKKAFAEIGEELQRTRKHGLAESLYSFIDKVETDPADEDEELKSKLAENKVHWQKINEVIDDFALRAKNKGTENKEGEGSEDEEEEEEDDDDDDEDEDEEDGEIPELQNLSDIDDDDASSEKSAAGALDDVSTSSPSSNGQAEEKLPSPVESSNSKSDVPDPTVEVSNVLEGDAEDSQSLKENNFDNIPSDLEVKSDSSATKGEQNEENGTDSTNPSIGLVNPEAREESFVVKSEPIDLPKVKIRVRSAKSLGGKDFNCPSVLQSENGDGSLSDEIIVLD